jgi:hypothetical protein
MIKWFIIGFFCGGFAVVLLGILEDIIHALRKPKIGG